MKTMNNVSKAQIEVWQWKENLAKKYESYSISEALEKIRDDSDEVMKKYKLGKYKDSNNEIKIAQG
jgi:predicted mannosyl-3-phosphoglycerate phosphatase (HAD superfamily)